MQACGVDEDFFDKVREVEVIRSDDWGRARLLPEAAMLQPRLSHHGYRISIPIISYHFRSGIASFCITVMSHYARVYFL